MIIKAIYESKDAQQTPTDAYLLARSKPNIRLNRKQMPLLIIRTLCFFITVNIWVSRLLIKAGIITHISIRKGIVASANWFPKSNKVILGANIVTNKQIGIVPMIVYFSIVLRAYFKLSIEFLAAARERTGTMAMIRAPNITINGVITLCGAWKKDICVTSWKDLRTKTFILLLNGGIECGKS